MESKKKDLFEEIWSKVGCMYLSDLNTETYRDQAIREAKRMDLLQYEEKQIADLCNYLSVNRADLISC